MNSFLMRRICLSLLGLIIIFCDSFSQPQKGIYIINDRSKTIHIQLDNDYINQKVTPKGIKKIYKYWHKVLSPSYPNYKIQVNCAGAPVEYFIQDYKLPAESSTAHWGHIEYNGAPWVEKKDIPFAITNGLQNRHISLWASHGRYFDQNKGFWKFQRPLLFETTEDLFTQTIVVPYLIPMLQNGGAIVFSPRERDWQEDEIIIDNDNPTELSSPITQGTYTEKNHSEKWQNTQQNGFAFHAGAYTDGENPFTQGTAKYAKTTRSKHASTITYQPRFQSAGNYAVYVSYQSLPNSISDAEYIITHQGQKTTYKVNQQMGGGTWVYLGTYKFDQGCSSANNVVLTNASNNKGVVTADAVRFGGGMGNIQRSGAISGLPRAIEGARYSAQWAGAPYKVYASKNGLDDYGDDINTRPLMTNWLSGGSCFNPTSEGLKVPIELALAIHSDAGISAEPNGLIGSLAVCTTEINDGVFASGVSRELSLDFAQRILDGLDRDLLSTYGRWNRRYLWDRNYAETRSPEIPSAILETMSHQNFEDMILGEDPNFRFTMARSIYKSILRFINDNHGRPSIVQPLAPKDFKIEIHDGTAILSWKPTTDKLEPTAVPTSYNVYIAEGESGFNNGVLVTQPEMQLQLTPGKQYNFKVTAVNRGGESFPSSVLSAIYHSQATSKILIIDGFTRLSGPAVIKNQNEKRFDLNEDPGVSYGMTAQWLGGKFIMGNQYDDVMVHADAMSALHEYNVESATMEAVENGLVDLNKYAFIDLMLGLQRNMPHALKHYKTFSPMLQRKLLAYATASKGLLVSGAYIGTDMTKASERAFLQQLFKIQYEGRNRDTESSMIHGLNMNFDIYRQLNKDHYAATSTDILVPDTAYTQGPFRPQSIMMYSDSTSAAVSYQCPDYTTIALGFPFETITARSVRKSIMEGLLRYALPRQEAVEPKNKHKH